MGWVAAAGTRLDETLQPECLFSTRAPPSPPARLPVPRRGQLLSIRDEAGDGEMLLVRMLPCCDRGSMVCVSQRRAANMVMNEVQQANRERVSMSSIRHSRTRTASK